MNLWFRKIKENPLWKYRKQRYEQMQQKQQIDEVLMRIRAFWLMHPNYRLGRLLEFIKPVQAQPTYFVENIEWIEYLDRLLDDKDILQSEGGKHYERL